MERITITLPEQMKAYVEEQVKSGSYGNTSEFIRDLIRHQQQEVDSIVEDDEKNKERLELEVLKGLRGKRKLKFTRQDLEELKSAVHEKAEEYKRNS